MITAKIYIIPENIPPSKISLQLGVGSSREWIKGELNSGGKPFKTNCWEYEFRQVKNDNWLDMKSEIISFLVRISSELNDLASSNCSVCLSIVMQKSDFSVGLDFSREEIGLLSDSGVSLDINCYSL